MEASLRDRYGVGSASKRRLFTLHSDPEMQVYDGVERASACSRPTLNVSERRVTASLESVVERQSLK